MSAKNAYRLINPHIDGTINTVIRAHTNFSAAKRFYKNISNYFTNHVPNFYFTIQNVETKDLTHFKVDEKRGTNDMVDFKLVRMEKNFSPELEKKMINVVEDLNKQSGGKHKHHHHDDDDDDESSSESSSSSDNTYKFPSSPIKSITYFYLPYYKLNISPMSPLDMYRIAVPMFNLPVNPVFEFRFDLYKYFV